MTGSSILPSASAPVTAPSGLPSPQYYRFFEAMARIQDAAPTNAQIIELQTQIAQLATDLGSPDGSVARIPKLDLEHAYPTLRTAWPLVSQGLLQNGFALVGIDPAAIGDSLTIPESWVLA